MSIFRTGDTVFTPSGTPAVVLKQNPIGHLTTLDRSKESLQSTTRHGYINGLTVDDRERFNGIMDDVKKAEDPESRIVQLQSKIEELAQEPKKNFVLAQYLTSELSHFMFAARVEPKVFTMNENKLKSTI